MTWTDLASRRFDPFVAGGKHDWDWPRVYTGLGPAVQRSGWLHSVMCDGPAVIALVDVLGPGVELSQALRAGSIAKVSSRWPSEWSWLRKEPTSS